MSIEITGLDEVERNLQRLVDGLPDQVQSALRAEAEGVVEASKARTPVDTGALRDSHRIGSPKVNGKEISLEITAGEGLDLEWSCLGYVDGLELGVEVT